MLVIAGGIVLAAVVLFAAAVLIEMDNVGCAAILVIGFLLLALSQCVG